MELHTVPTVLVAGLQRNVQNRDRSILSLTDVSTMSASGGWQLLPQVSVSYCIGGDTHFRVRVVPSFRVIISPGPLSATKQQSQEQGEIRLDMSVSTSTSSSTFSAG